MLLAFKRSMIVFLATFLMLPIGAQSSSEDDNEKNQKSTGELGVVEQITVTARQRAESVEKVPISATVFSESEIENADIESVSDFIGLTSNVSFEQSQNPGNNTMTVRGISQVRNGDAPFAVMIDGVYQASPNSINQSLINVERIEVLKGPQGALYGRNAIGGVISIVSKTPGHEHVNRAEVGYGKENEYEIQLSSSGPITDTLYYQISGLYRDRDGYFTNETLQVDADPKTDKDISAWLSYLPNDRFSLNFKASASSTKDGGAYYIPVYNGNANEVDTNPVSELLPYAERDLREYSLRAEYISDAGTFTFIGSGSSVDELVYADDYLPVSFVWASQDLDVSAKTVEMRFSSPDDRKFRWIAGAFYLQKDSSLATIVDVDFDDDGVFDLNIPRVEDNDNRSQAIFGQVNYDVNENLELSLALRYDEDDREQFNPANGAVRDKTFDKFQPRLSVSWSPSETSMLFATYAEGFRSGGFNAPSVTAFPPIYDAESTQAFEAGFKSTWLERKVQFNAAVFTTDFENQQYYVYDGPSGSQGLLNIDESLAQGIELELQAHPGNGFRIDASLGITDTEIKALTGNSEFVGNKTPNSNAYTGNLSLLHETRFNENSRLVARADYRRVGKRYWAINNEHARDPLNLLNLRLTYIAKRWSVGLYLDNATDEQYSAEFLQGEFSGITYDIRFPALPQRYGVEFSTRF